MRLINEHKFLEGMLNDAIRIILSYENDIYIKEQTQVLNQVNVFLENYTRLIEPHHQFEEKIFFPALQEKYGVEIKKLIEEHEYIGKLVQNIRRRVFSRDIDNVLSGLRILYEIGIKHMGKEDKIIKEVMKSLDKPRI